MNFGKKSKSEDPVTVVNKTTVITGNLSAKGSVEVFGKVLSGKASEAPVAIVSQGDVFVDKEAVVIGDIQAKDVYIEGDVTGNVFAVGKVHLAQSCKLNGRIDSASLVIESGVSFAGNVNTKAQEGKNLEERNVPYSDTQPQAI